MTNFILNLLLWLFYNFGASTPASNAKCAVAATNGFRKYLVMANGRCYIPQASSSIKNTRLLSYSFKKISNQFTLYRIVSGSNMMSYNFYITPGNSSSPVVDTNQNYSQNFRSALLDDWNIFQPASMNVTIRDYNDKVVGFLLFSVRASDTVTSWFNKNNLLSSYPWNTSTLMGYTYLYFTIPPLLEYGQRSFYIINYLLLCIGDFGVMGVIDKSDSCSMLQILGGVSLVHPQVLYAVSGTGSDNWSHVIFAKSLQITGIYNSSLNIYN